MKLDRQKKTEKLGRHIPGFHGYSAIHLRETDLLLRRHLVTELEKVRDRLADFMASSRSPKEGEGFLGELLQSVARFKKELAPAECPIVEKVSFTPVQEEQLLDLDMALLEKVVGLHSPLDAMETAPSEVGVGQAAGLFSEGLSEARELFGSRGRVWSEGGSGGGNFQMEKG